MPEASGIAAMSLHAAAVMLLVYWSISLYHVVRTRRSVPTARAGLEVDPPGPLPRVALIVPAHDEAAAISRLLESLRVQAYPALRVVVVLDRCTDDSGAIVRRVAGDDPRFEVIEVDRCPDGWSGKVHAVWRGVQDSAAARDAEVLAFTDADTVFDPSCLRATVGLLRTRGLDLLSLLSTLTGDRWFERMVQPAATIETVTQYPLTRASKPGRRKAFANGQYMLFTRAAYEAVGGHAAVRDALLEDLALAKRVARAGRPAGIFLADGLLTCRMYDSWPAFRSGWKRIFIELSSRRADRLARYAWRPRLFGCLLPLAATADAAMSAAGAPGFDRAAGLGVSLSALAVFLAAVGALYRLARTPLWTLPGYVVGSWLLGGILSSAARDVRRGHPIEWAGRTYVLTGRPGLAHGGVASRESMV